MKAHRLLDVAPGNVSQHYKYRDLFASDDGVVLSTIEKRNEGVGRKYRVITHDSPVVVINQNIEGHGYAGFSRVVGGQMVRLKTHRFVFECWNGEIPASAYIDHIDHDRANNAISNLRLASNSQNMANMTLTRANKSGFKGVSWCSSRGYWEAKITHNYRSINLGRFSSAELAAAAYDAAAMKLFGQHAFTNKSMQELTPCA